MTTNSTRLIAIAALNFVLFACDHSPPLPRPNGSTVVRAGTERVSAADFVITDREIRDARGNGITTIADSMAALASSRDPDVLILDVAPSTPHKFLSEVLRTAMQAKWRGFDLRLLTEPQRHVVSHLPHSADVPSTTSNQLNLMVLVAEGGIALKGSGGNIAPGCDNIGSGLAIPNRQGRHDLDALQACIQKLKAQFPAEHAMFFAASPTTAFADHLAVLEVVQGPHLERFPDVMYVVPASPR